jgi:hypothetical protein
MGDTCRELLYGIIPPWLPRPDGPLYWERVALVIVVGLALGWWRWEARRS